MSASDASPDEDARRGVRERLDQTLFVEAGAGTGKTTTLVERYVAMVLAGHAVESLVGITFTDRAAAELRDRIRVELEQRAAQEPDAHGLLAKALAQLDRAPISTIHAFCHSLLRTYAVRLGIDPAFEVLDEVAAERRFETRWREYLEGLGEEPAARAVLSRLLDLGLAPFHLEHLARALWQNPALAERIDRRPPAISRAPWPNIAALLATIDAIDLDRVPQDDRLRQRLEGLRLSLVDLDAADEARESYLASAVAGLNPSFQSAGRQPAWGSAAAIARARETGATVCRTLTETLAALRSDALGDALPLVVRFVLADARARYREGRLVFDDLILRVRDVLRDDGWARDVVRRRFDAMLIDEFQDTDPLQIEIALAFATPPGGDRPQPGRLFVVGDPKQSIYRFRRADMAAYDRARRTLLAAGAAEVSLAANRRSGSDLIAWFNRVFERVIGPGEQPELQPAYRSLNATRSPGLAGPPVGWFGAELEQTAREVRRREARAVAAACRHVVEQGWEVEDRDGKTRQASFRDVAVLVPARTVLPALERAFGEAAIPYRVEGGTLVYATQEVRDLINCLTAIDDPTDEVALVAALRSPAYACSDVDLARFRLQGGRWSYLGAAAAGYAEGPVAAALLDLEALHHARRDLSIAAVLQSFVTGRSLIESGMFDSGNRDAFRRVHFLLHQARAFESRGPESLRAFIEWLERRAAEAVYDQEGANLDDDEDAVRVLTVHAAKGLEFPVVILAGLGSAPRWQPAVLGHDRQGERIGIRLGSASRNNLFTLGPVEAINQHEQDHARAERDRLLYVAATRARDHLLFSLFRAGRSRDSYAQRLVEGGARQSAIELPDLALASAGAATPFAGLRIDPPAVSGSEFVAARRRLVARAKRREYTSATSLRRLLAEEEPSDESEPWARGRAGSHLGRAVHAALQTLPWDADGATVEAVARAQAVAEAVPGQAALAARLIGQALATDAAARARAARRALREVPFAFRDGRVVAEGFVDVVIEGEDGLEVVDWKTDDVMGEEIDRRLAQYRLQAGLYVLGLERATGRHVGRITYVFVRSAEERSPGEPRELASLARTELERLRLGGLLEPG